MGLVCTLFGVSALGALLTVLLGKSAPPAAKPPAGRRPLRNTQPLYEERGWKLRGDTLHGWYRTRFGAFEGRIDQPFSKHARYWIIRPPEQLLSGPHSGCFFDRGQDRFEIHFSTKPPDANAGILCMEHTLMEALR